MIRNIHYQCPCTQPETATELQQQLAALSRLHPFLLGATITWENNTLNLRLRIGGVDRWKISSNSRRIITTMLRRVKLDWTQATLISEEPEQTARSLTKETGRNPGHTPRGRKAKTWQHIPWTGDPR